MTRLPKLPASVLTLIGELVAWSQGAAAPVAFPDGEGALRAFLAGGEAPPVVPGALHGPTLAYCTQRLAHLCGLISDEDLQVLITAESDNTAEGSHGSV